MTKISVVGLGLGASVGLNLTIQQTIVRALQLRERLVTQSEVSDLGGFDEQKDIILVAECELIEHSACEALLSAEWGINQMSQFLVKAFHSHHRIFSLCNLPVEDGSKKQIVLLFTPPESSMTNNANNANNINNTSNTSNTSNTNSDISMDNADINNELDLSTLNNNTLGELKGFVDEFSQALPGFALTPEELTVRKIKQAPGVGSKEEEHKTFEISLPGSIGRSKFLSIVRNLQNEQQQKLVEWLTSKAIG